MTMEEFFEQPVPPEIELQVEYEVKAIRYAVDFGEWLLNNYQPLKISKDERRWISGRIGDASFTTGELFQLWNSELEKRDIQADRVGD